MSADSNMCQSVSDKVGDKVKFAIDVIEKDGAINATFEDKQVATSSFDGGKAILMTEVQKVRHIFYLTIADGKANGTAEGIEADASGEYGKPCATYKVSLVRGDKPATDKK